MIPAPTVRYYLNYTILVLDEPLRQGNCALPSLVGKIAYLFENSQNTVLVGAPHNPRSLQPTD